MTIPEKPKIRGVEVFPVQLPQGIAIGLRDPQHLTDSVLTVNRETLLLLSLLDGTRTISEIQADYVRLTGSLIYKEKIEELVKTLQEHYFLEDAHFQEHRAQIVKGFQELKVRPYFHAGAYPTEPDALRKFMQSIFTSIPAHSSSERPVAIIAPHIDYIRGKTAYAACVRAIESYSYPLFIILGTSHYASGETPYILTEKDFETPLGVVKTDAGRVRQLARSLPFSPFDEEFAHRAEHSIEFQTTLLKALFPLRDFRILPVLCCPLEKFSNGQSPLSHTFIRSFIQNLKAALREVKQALLIASVDFSHVGPKFGDTQPVHPAHLKVLERYDKDILQLALKGDSEGFYQQIIRNNNRTNIDAVSPVYTLLSALDGVSQGTLLHYEQAYEPETASVVSFAAASFSLPASTP